MRLSAHDACWRAILGTKVGLDIDWNDVEQKVQALNRLCEQLERLSAWVAKRRLKDGGQIELSLRFGTGHERLARPQHPSSTSPLQSLSMPSPQTSGPV